jgi:undecaprenyl-diphosphatase
MLELVQQLDERALRWIAEYLRTPLWDKMMVFYTFLGNGGWAFITVGVLLLLFRKTRKSGASALAGMLLGLLVTNLTLKPLVARLRPWMVMENFTVLVTSSDLNSFPSGHTCAAFAFAVAVTVAVPRKWVKAAALAAAALMGFSRLYVGVHFPTDVIAGTIVGTLCGLVGAWIVDRAITWIRARRSAE